MEKLTVAQKKSLLAFENKGDPKGELVSLQPDAQFKRGTLEYNLYNGLVLHETITQLTDEEWIRAYLVVRLVKELRYPADCLELETTYSIGHDSVKKAQIDIKVTDKRDPLKAKTWMMIETKRPDEFKTFSDSLKGQVFDLGKQEIPNGVRYGVWYSLDFVGDVPRDSCIVIDLQEHPEYSDWVDAGEPGHNLDLPLEYGLVRKQSYANISEEDAKKDADGPQPLREDVTRDELSRLQRDFHNILWGGAKMGDTQVFDNLLKIFLAKIYDELTTEADKPYRFQVELHNGKPESPEQITAKINKLIADAVKNFFPERNADSALLTIDSDIFKPNKVMLTVERLEGISIVRNTYQDDVLGAFFESIVRTGFKQDKGQFFTHSKITQFILHALELDLWPIELINNGKPRLPYIVDPSCGSGTFLLEAMKLITESVMKTNKDKLSKSIFVTNFLNEMFQPFSPNKNSHNIWARHYIFGIEGSPNLAMATKVNMILHGDGNANIIFGDGLAPFEKYAINPFKTYEQDDNAPYKSVVNEQFDCVISNPPFSLKEDARTLSEYALRFDFAGEKNSEALFVERWFQLLKEGGRLGVVLPDSIFDTNENLPIRMMLFRLFHIRAVVSLPPVTFQPYTPTKTSLLFAFKKTREEVKSWDDAWRKASGEYGKLRISKVVAFVLKNDRLRDRLIGRANRLSVEWYPADSLLHADALPDTVREQLLAAATGNAKKELVKDLEELDTLVAADSLANLDADDAKETLARLLRERFPQDANEMMLRELVSEAYDEIVQAGKLDFAATIKEAKYTNSWWCFAEVTGQDAFDSDIFFAEAQEVGYKRTTRHPDGLDRPNELYTEDKDGKVVIDTENPKTILDHLRSKKVFFCQAPAIRCEPLSRLANNFFLRCDAKYRLFWGAIDGKLFPESTMPFHPLKYATVPIQVRKAKKGELDQEYQLIDLEDVEQRSGFILQSNATETLGSDKLIFGDSDILTTKLRPNLGKTILNRPDEPLIGTTEWIPFKINSQRLLPVIFKWYLLSPRFIDNAGRLLSGKEHPRVSQADLENLLVPFPPLHLQRQIATQIEAIEADISTARDGLEKPSDAIDRQLSTTFGFGLDEYRNRKRPQHFERSLSSFAGGFGLRSSVKFHHPDFEIVADFLRAKPHKRISEFLAVPIRLGAQLTQAALDDEGEAFYVHPSATKKQEPIETADCHRVTQEFYDDQKERNSLRPNDVLLNRSGEGTIGKVAIYNLENQPCIFADFVMRLRFNERMNPRFAWYYGRSLFFQSQVEREKRGMGNLTNIFPSQVETLLVPDIGREKQDELADSIAAELKILADRREAIEQGRRDIENLLENALKSAV